MSKCIVCERDDVGAINAALRLGGPTGTVRAVSDRHGVKRTVLGEHRTECLRLEGRNGPKALRTLTRAVSLPDKSADNARLSADKQDGDCPREEDEVNAKTVPIANVAARAREPMDPRGAKTFRERSLVCADMLARGQWERHLSAKYLGALWGAEPTTVTAYLRAAQVRCALDGGDTAALLEDTLGSLIRQEREATDLAHGLEETAASYEMIGPDDETDGIEARTEAATRLRQTATKYREIALKARAKMADVGGLIKYQVAVTVDQDPRVAAFVDHLLNALDAYGDEVRQALAAFGAQNEGVVPALPDPREYVEGKVREYTAEKKEAT